MAKARDDDRFVLEAPRADLIERRAEHELDRHVATEHVHLLGAIHDAHPARADPLDDAITSVEDRSDESVVHSQRSGCVLSFLPAREAEVRRAAIIFASVFLLAAAPKDEA